MAGGRLLRMATELLDHCNSMSQLKQIHGVLVITSSLSPLHSYSLHFASKIISFSALSHLGDLHYSLRFLSHFSNPTLFHWNTVVRGFSAGDDPSGFVSVFVHMLRIGLSPDNFTFTFVSKSVARLRDLRLGLSIHARIMNSGFGLDRFVANSLIHVYSSCGDIFCARKVFDEMPARNLVSWNAMVGGYAKCGDMGLAREVFESMLEKDVVSWSSLIDGYVKSGEYREAMAVFRRMRVECPDQANEVTMVSVLSACAHLGALEQGRLMHRYVIDHKLPFTLVLRTSLVDMYAKCGSIEESLQVFRSGLVNKTDVALWNSIIGGLATHGLVHHCLELYSQMQETGIRPDEITYLCLLSACAHAGLVNQAWHFLHSISKHGMRPQSEHYACMLDVLARAGQLEEAFTFLTQMTVKPTASMLGALLSGCINRGRLDLAEAVGRKLIELEPGDGGRYVGLSNVYAVFKRWDDKRTTREAMERRGMRKSPAFSFVEVSGFVHRFSANDKTHPDCEFMFSILSLVVKEMKVSVGENRNLCIESLGI